MKILGLLKTSIRKLSQWTTIGTKKVGCRYRFGMNTLKNSTLE
jgi:hypothetical protein